MALKILKEIGTSKGITSNAYIRISSYEINKIGYLKLNIQLFQNENDSINDGISAINKKEVINIEVGNSMNIPLTKTLTRPSKSIIQEDVEKELQIPIMDENGKYTGEFRIEKQVVKMPKEIDINEEYQVPDLSIIEGKDIFAFGYEHLKAKLSETFGAENVVDC